MRCEAAVLPAGDPFAALRRDFERCVGLPTGERFGAMSITESESMVRVEIDVPGVSLQNLDLTVHEGKLSVAGRRNATAPEGAKVRYSDRGTNEFQRVLALDESLDPDSVEAAIENGVLSIELKRRAKAQPQRIEIRTVEANRPDSEATN
ncbi:MAG: Hsp20/alpha crystallin family protein [Planctomycetaceae bacterium]